MSPHPLNELSFDNPGDLRTLIGRFLDRLGAKITDPSGDEADLDSEMLFLEALARPIVSQDPVFIKEWEEEVHKERPRDVDPEVWARRVRFAELRALVSSLARLGTLVRLRVPDWQVPDPEGQDDEKIVGGAT
jgi:hypothetical protein